MSSTVVPTTCPHCSAPAAGHFCANCGSPLSGALCAGCGSALTPGAKFCHRCGTAVGSGGGAAAARSAGAPAGGRPQGDWLPWGVAAVALLAIVALVAGQSFRAQRGGALDAPSNAIATPGLDDRGADAAPVAPFAGGAAGAGRAPDISSLSPEERASRLFDRVMRYDEQGKRDSLLVFAPMAMQAFEMIGTLDADQRYDLGRIGEVSGNYNVAKAQADTILRDNPTHLLALALAARMSPDPKVAREYQQKLLAAAPAELKKGLPEYRLHQGDIDRALAQARTGKP